MALGVRRIFIASYLVETRETFSQSRDLWVETAMGYNNVEYVHETARRMTSISILYGLFIYLAVIGTI